MFLAQGLYVNWWFGHFWFEALFSLGYETLDSGVLILHNSPQGEGGGVNFWGCVPSVVGKIVAFGHFQLTNSKISFWKKRMSCFCLIC